MLPPFSWCFTNAVDEYAGYAVVSEYFGRGLFNKLTVVTEPPAPAAGPAPAPQPAPAPPVPAPQPKTYGPGAEAKLRLQEGQSKQVFVPNTTKQVTPKGTAIIPVPEGRMRVLEQQRYSSSLEANLNRLQPRVHAARTSPMASPMPTRKQDDQPRSTGVSPKISSAIANAKNPFEEETYDDAMNPFADEVATDPTNPFGEDDDYDKNLNPFA